MIYAHLRDAAQAHDLIVRVVWPRIKEHFAIGGGSLDLMATPERRSSEANAKLHAELNEVAKVIPWAGRLRDIDVWKRLMTAAWLRARGENIELLPALDGHGVDVVFRRTSTLSRAETSELIEFVLAWKAENMP